MPVQSLVSLCTKACIKNVRNITDVGDFEYWKVRHILSRVTNPEQLHEIELTSPQILGEDAELWKAFIARDIPDWKKKNYVPKNPLKWYEVYLKYRREQQQEIERDKAKLREAMMGLQKQKAANVSKKIEARYLPKLPKDSRMMANNGGVPIAGRGKGSKPLSSVMSWSAGSKTKMKDPASVLTRARREAKEITSRNKLGKPTHQLLARPSQVLKAPKGMVNEYRRAAEPQMKIYTPKTPLRASNGRASVSGPSAKEREDRLRALTAKHIGNTANATVVGSDSDNLLTDDDLEDLFGDKTSPSSTPSIPAQPHPSTAPVTKARPLPKPAVRSQKNIRMVPSANLSSGKLAQEFKPSDVISSIISKSKPQQATPARPASARPAQVPTSPQSSPSPPNTGSPRGFSSLVQQNSAAPAGSGPRPMIRKRKPEVDIFNRSGAATKKPRAVR